MTRSVSAHLFHSLNGVVSDPHLWQFGLFGPEEGELMAKALDGVTDVVIGAQLWREWSDYWPSNAEDGFAEFINPVRKHVISSTLAADSDGELGWNSTLLTADPVDAVRALADNGATGRIAVTGGVRTVRSLFLAGVIDTLTLTTHPVVTPGERLFDESVPLTRLELVDGTTTGAGNAVLTYRLHRD